MGAGGSGLRLPQFVGAHNLHYVKLCIDVERRTAETLVQFLLPDRRQANNIDSFIGKS